MTESARAVQKIGSLEEIPPSWGITCDSREELKNKVFVCIRGRRHDGHADAADALRRGAVLIVAERDIGLESELIVPDSRTALARLAARHYGCPAAGMRIIGITGTNGKTTTAHILCHLLQAAGIRVGRIGTDGIMWSGKTLPNPNTTPEPLLLHRTLAAMRRDGITTVVMEVSSQALAQKRVEGITFAAGVFTNLSQDHLDYHPDMESYFAAKARLFTQSRMAVLNTADPYGRRLLETAAVPVIPYHLPEERECTVGEGSIPWRGGRMTVPFTGEVFLYDALAAAETALALGIPCSLIRRVMATCPPVRGRAELLYRGAGRLILRDYAHTPDALEQILCSLKKLHHGKITVLFGCGGDRDAKKRPLMGAAAARHAHQIILTDDNPRSEAPETIRREIAKGIPKDYPCIEIPDRKAAIRQAILAMEPGELLLLAGKGHETDQILKDRTIPFDEKAVVNTILESENIPWKNNPSRP